MKTSFFGLGSQAPYIIAEIGVNHNGSADMAIELIDVASRGGANAVKFQTFRTEACISRFCELEGYQRVAGMSVTTQYEMLKSLELDESQHIRLKAHAEACGLAFISTPDDDWSINLLAALDVQIVKISSAEIVNMQHLQLVGRLNKPTILSTGMSNLEEVKTAFAELQRAGASEIALLHCTSNYPCIPENANIRALSVLERELDCVVGYSDHTVGVEAGIIAVALGARILEKHITLDRGLRGPDHAASMEPIEFAEYVATVRRASVMLGNGVKEPQLTELPMRLTMRRSIVASRGLETGHRITEADIAFKRAGAGIVLPDHERVLGRRLGRAKIADEPISWEDLIDD